jgi:hypothetical protein
MSEEIRKLARQLVAELETSDAMMDQRDDYRYECTVYYLMVAKYGYGLKALKEGGFVLVKQGTEEQADLSTFYKDYAE